MEINDRVYEAAWAHLEARDQVGIKLGMANANKRYAKKIFDVAHIAGSHCRAELHGIARSHTTSSG